MTEVSITLIQAGVGLAQTLIDLTSGAAESSCTPALVTKWSASRVLARPIVAARLKHGAYVVGDAAGGTNQCRIETP